MPFFNINPLHLELTVVPRERSERLDRVGYDRDEKEFGHNDSPDSPVSGHRDRWIHQKKDRHHQITTRAGGWWIYIPTDIRFPVYLILLNKMKKKLEEIYDVLCLCLKGEEKPRIYHEKARRDFLFVSLNRKQRKKMIRKRIRKQN